MTEQEMFERTFQRPRNFFDLPYSEQWFIDNTLGLLDWQGTGLSEADKARFDAHYTKDKR
jgi:hypothetical protein